MTAAAVVVASDSLAARAEDLAVVVDYLEADLVEAPAAVVAQGGPADSMELAGLAVLEAAEEVLRRTVTISLRIGVDPITINGIGFKPI